MSPLVVEQGAVKPVRWVAPRDSLIHSGRAELLDVPWGAMDARLRAQWTEMSTAGGLNPSLGPAWIEAAATAWGLLDRLRVAVFVRDETVVGFAPFLLRRVKMNGVTMRALQLGGNVVSYHQEVVASGSHAEFLRELLAYSSRYGWDVFEASNLVRGGPTDTALNALKGGWGRSHLTCPGEASPYLTLPADWDAYVRAQRPTFRYRIRRVERELSGTQGSEVRWYSKEHECGELLSQIISIDDRSWKVAERMNISARREERRYYELLLPSLARAGILFANVLHLENRPVAYSLCYAQNGQVGQMKTSFDEDVAKLKPGLSVTIASMRKAVDDGHREYDFLGDVMRHKLDWTDRLREHVNHFVFSRTPRGVLLGGAKRLLRALRAVRSGPVEAPAAAQDKETPRI